MSFEFREQ